MFVYKAVFGYNFAIFKHQIDRESDSFVWLTHDKGRRTAKASYNSQFFKTWDEAHSFLLEKHKRVYNSAKENLDRAAKQLNTVVEMTNPEKENI